METIFENVGGVARTDDTEQDYGSRIRSLIDDAVDFERSHFAIWREDNQKYYDGVRPGLNDAEMEDTVNGATLDDPHAERQNRSTYVSTDVRDTIMTVLPSLMRIFTSPDQEIASFVPNTEADQDMADQQFDYANYVMMKDNPGFNILYSVFKDALIKRAGFTKWWTDTNYEVTEKTFQNITQEQMQYLIFEVPDVEVVDQGELNPETGFIDTVTLRYAIPKPLTKFEAVPPEEFRMSKDAKTIKESRLVGHERMVSVSELVKRGYGIEDVEGYIGSSSIEYSDEKQLRNPALLDSHYGQQVLFGEWYIRIDGDGDGIDELRYIETIGDSYDILSDEVVAQPRFAAWLVDIIPHTLVGDSLADMVKDVQRMKTNLMRGQLDNLAETINPRTVVNELVTNIEDVLSDEVGAVIRTRGDAGAAVSFHKTPYSGEEIQVTVDYLDRVRASRTGITEASKGLDPKAMQSTSLVGIDAIVSGAQERIELMARVLAETGFRETIEGIAREITDNPNQLRTIKLRGKWVDVNPSLFDVTMRLEINPTLGKGTDTIRLQALQEVKQTQLLILDKFGINNPVVSPVEFRNTVVDILAIANIKNPTRYFKDITPEIMAAIATQPKEPDPATLLAQAELEKVKKDMVIAGGKFDQDQRRIESQDAKFKADDDFRRDKLNIDAAIEIAKIASSTEPSVPEGVSSANQPLTGE